MAEPTLMMKQYLEIKEQYSDAILFFRLGDFYEMFYDDAKVASEILNIALTGKNCGQEERAPMCGVPYHSVEPYIAKLIAAGLKVAICEQTEAPQKGKKLVDREVVRLITPGTILDGDFLASKTTNYMCCIFKDTGGAGITFCEVSTGDIMTTSFIYGNETLNIIDELARFAPVEIIINIDGYEDAELKKYIDEKTEARLELCNDAYFLPENAEALISSHFKDMNDELNQYSACATGALLSYILQTQQMDPQHIRNLEVYESAQYMGLDQSARRNLEIVESMRDKRKTHSLFWVLDDTKTAMGSRILKNWLLRPLLNCAKINHRLNAVASFKGDNIARDNVREVLCYISDLERAISRIVMGSANPRDLVKMRESIKWLPRLKKELEFFDAPLIKEISDFDELYDIYDILVRGIVEDPPLAMRDGKIIQKGYNEELDRLRVIRDKGTGAMAEVENAERERTGIKNLKVKYNKVFGYYIEISNMYKDRVPDDYIRKQTITTGERYITQRLKEIEDEVLGAAEKIAALEYKLFGEIRDILASQVDRIQRTARCVATVDALCALAEVAYKNNYTYPVVDMSDSIEISGGRHPVVEKVLRGSLFVPNDTSINTSDRRLTILTGPNMAGKSTYMRQAALIIIMAQIGSFVPCDSCKIGVVDKVFTRVGASDDLAAGQSTFMVEMSEVAGILKNATGKSLLILDEIGRGTSTYDGLSIAWAVLEYCAQKIKAKTLFATHYHELTALEGKMDGVVNNSIAVKKRNDDIIFLRKIVQGGADESYGIEVAKLAGVPDKITKRAKEILEGIESEGTQIRVISNGRRIQKDASAQIGFDAFAGNEIVEELKKIDPNVLTPIEALGKLFELSKKAKEGV